MPYSLVLDLTKARHRDRLKGGKADKKSPADFPKDALDAGTEHELEHTDDRSLAREIAMDHLAEDLNYYKKLKRIEKSERAKPYGHIAYTRTDHRSGRLVQVRARGFKQEKGPFGRHEWYRANLASLQQAGVQAQALKPGETPDFAKVREWLGERGLKLPDYSLDTISPRKQKQWLEAMGPAAFGLGITLYGLKGEAITKPNELPKLGKTRPYEKYGMSSDTIGASLDRFAEKTNFHVTFLNQGLTSADRVETAHAIMRSVEGLSLVLNMKPEFGVEVGVSDRYDGANAQYIKSSRTIVIDKDNGKHSFYHEFGHFFDHYLGGNDFVSEHGVKLKRQSPVKAWYEAACKTHSYKLWGGDAYLKRPTEMFARYFDQWCHKRLTELGHDAKAEFYCDPFWDRTARSGGHTFYGSQAYYNADDFTALRPIFEAIIQPHIKKALLLFLDLIKGRTSGSTNKKRVSKAKHGVIISMSPAFKYPNGVRYLKARDNAMAILATYSAKGIPVEYVAPSAVKKYDFNDFIARRDQHLTILNQSQALKDREERKHEPLTGKAAKQVVAAQAKIEKLREGAFVVPGKGGAKRVDALSVLRRRMLHWEEPSDFKVVVDPLMKPQHDALVTLRRQLSRADAAVKAGKTVQEKALASAEYASVQRQIEKLQGAAHATSGAGLFKIGSSEVQLIEQLPHTDLGFSPTERPMSYLLSIGWNVRKDGRNVFNQNQQAALLYEYGAFLRGLVYQLGPKFNKFSPLPMRMLSADEQERKRLGVQALWGQTVEQLFSMAERYLDPEPTENRNFAALIYGTMQRVMTTKLVREAMKAKTELSFDELEDMPMSSSGNLITPATRIESPSDYAIRIELAREIREALSGRLSLEEEAAFLSRLNLGEYMVLTGTTAAEIAVPEAKTSGETKVRLENVKPWSQVKEDVALAVENDASRDPDLRTPLAHNIRMMSDETVAKIWNRAVGKMRDLTGTPEIRAKLTELLDRVRGLMTGQKHEWGEDPSLARHIVRPEAVDAEDIKKLSKKYAALSERIGASRQRSARKKLVEQRTAIARELSALRGKLKLQEALHEPKGRSPGQEPVAFDRSAAKFWSDKRFEKLREALSVSLAYQSFSRTKGVAPPKQIRLDVVRARKLYQAASKLLAATPDKFADAKKAPQYADDGKTTVLMGGVRLPADAYRRAIKVLTALRRRGQTTAKSLHAQMLVIPDLERAANDLIASCG